MKQTRILMGMPITLEIVDSRATLADLDSIFFYFISIDEQFCPYKKTSEVSKINLGKIKLNQCSDNMKEVLELCEQTKQETYGYFDVFYKGKLDPCGLVKGWAILNAAKLLKQKGFKNFYVDAGGDIQSFGKNKNGHDWTIGIRNPFKAQEIIKSIMPKNKGVATSGIYERGEHIYNPKSGKQMSNNIASLTVIGPNIYEADRFATAAFAMGEAGINFIGGLQGFEGYMVDKTGIATYTTGFEKFVI